MNNDKAKAEILDWCSQRVECLARRKVLDLVGTLDAAQTSPETARVTGSWTNNQELIALCMDMLGDIPGETLDQRVEKLVGWHLELQLLHGNEVNRSLSLEMDLNQCRDHAPTPAVHDIREALDGLLAWTGATRFGISDAEERMAFEDDLKIAQKLSASLADTSTDCEDK
jgi:hypothetical protein